MKRVAPVVAIAATLLFGAAANARAAEARPRTTADLAEQPQQAAPWTLAGPRKSLQRDSSGKWGLRLGLNQPSLREPDWKDMQAGAFFRITPSLRVGGSVQLGDRLAQPKQVTPGDAATPRVHLETAFRF
jgi:hypothetical protein